MTKYDELNTSGSCWNSAFPSELVFVLLERDPCAAATIRAWAEFRVSGGFNKSTDKKIIEAYRMALMIDGRKDT